MSSNVSSSSLAASAFANDSVPFWLRGVIDLPNHPSKPHYLCTPDGNRYKVCQTEVEKQQLIPNYLYKFQVAPSSKFSGCYLASNVTAERNLLISELLLTGQLCKEIQVNDQGIRGIVKEHGTGNEFRFTLAAEKVKEFTNHPSFSWDMIGSLGKTKAVKFSLEPDPENGTYKANIVDLKFVDVLSKKPSTELNISLSKPFFALPATATTTSSKDNNPNVDGDNDGDNDDDKSTSSWFS